MLSEYRCAAVTPRLLLNAPCTHGDSPSNNADVHLGMPLPKRDYETHCIHVAARFRHAPCMCWNSFPCCCCRRRIHASSLSTQGKHPWTAGQKSAASTLSRTAYNVHALYLHMHFKAQSQIEECAVGVHAKNGSPTAIGEMPITLRPTESCYAQHSTSR